jgi:putative peptidoglycan lipid II flippase
LRRTIRRGIHASIALVGTLSALGYILSILRDSVLARYYGHSSSLDVYFVALLPSQFVGTEAASLAYLVFLPEFSRAIEAGDEDEHHHLLRARLSFVIKGAGLAAAAFAAIGLLFTPVLAPGYISSGALGSLRASFVVLSTMIPCLAILGVMRASLEAHGHFSAWALLPAFRSTALIACVLVSATRPAVGWLVSGTLLGLCLSLGYALLVGRSHKSPIPAFARSLRRAPSELPSSVAPLLASIFVGQLTAMLDNAFASHTGVGGVQAFALASNLLSVPHTILAGAVSTAYYPLFGSLWASDRKDTAVASLRKSARLTVVVLLPVMALLIVEGGVVVRLIYQHGTFDAGMTQLVTSAVAGLAIGQVAYASALLLRQFLLVAGVPWVLLQGAVLFLAIKWVGNAFLTPRLGLTGIAVSSSLAATVLCIFYAIRVMYTARVWRNTRA